MISPHSPFSSLKDDDSGDHDQDQGSPKDGEKEKAEDEEKEQNVSKKKVGARVFLSQILLFGLTHNGMMPSWKSIG